MESVTEFKESDAGKPARFHVGDFFDIVLRENPTTGFRWKMVANGEGCCDLVNDDFAAGSVPGAGGTHRWHFRATHAGETRIEMTLERPGTASPTAGQTFALGVTVTA